MIENVLVTGSSGHIGRFVVPELREHGYAVTGTDVKPPDRDRDAHMHTLTADMCDLGQVFGVMHGQDAVIHLAAIPSLGSHPPEVVFNTNVTSTFNVLQAATVLGIKHVVLASSIQAFGFTSRYQHFDPHYIPIDDAHPLLPQDAYGLSKAVGEQIADGFARRSPDMSIVSLRFTAVLPPDMSPEQWEAFRSSPGSARSFWSYIDARDAARACRLAMEYTTPGHEALLIVAPETYMDEPTRDLLDRAYPGAGRIAEGFGGRMGVFDCSRAERLLGFEPQYNRK